LTFDLAVDVAPIVDLDVNPRDARVELHTIVGNSDEDHENDTQFRSPGMLVRGDPYWTP
jgi:hypothetical protein